MLVVVAEILLNRLLHPARSFHFDQGLGRGHGRVPFVRRSRSAASSGNCRCRCCRRTFGLLLLSATVGNATEFLNWLDRSHGRKLDLVEGQDRKVPLNITGCPTSCLTSNWWRWPRATTTTRRTPALVFCFNRDECWSVAETLKGLDLLPGADEEPLARRGQQARLDRRASGRS